MNNPSLPLSQLVIRLGGIAWLKPSIGYLLARVGFKLWIYWHLWDGLIKLKCRTMNVFLKLLVVGKLTYSWNIWGEILSQLNALGLHSTGIGQLKKWCCNDCAVIEVYSLILTRCNAAFGPDPRPPGGEGRTGWRWCSRWRSPGVWGH